MGFLKHEDKDNNGMWIIKETLGTTYQRKTD